MAIDFGRGGAFATRTGFCDIHDTASFSWTRVAGSEEYLAIASVLCSPR